MSIFYSKRAAKSLRPLPQSHRDAILTKIQLLSEGKARDVKRLHGREGSRLRVGDYRITYFWREQDLFITRVDKRSRVYER